MKRYALMGLDGSGKSTILELLKQDPRFGGFSFVWVRWEPKLLKPLYRRLHGKKAERSEERPTAAARYGEKQQLKKRIFSDPLVGRLWLLAALFDYWLQFYKKYRPLHKSGKHIIFDRYYFDLFLDQGLNIGLTPEQIVKVIRRNAVLFPDIQKVIYIRVSPAVCFARKDDIPAMEYLNARFEVYELLNRELGWIAVNGEEPLEVVYRLVSATILEGETA